MQELTESQMNSKHAIQSSDEHAPGDLSQRILPAGVPDKNDPCQERSAEALSLQEDTEPLVSKLQQSNHKWAPQTHEALDNPVYPGRLTTQGPRSFRSLLGSNESQQTGPNEALNNSMGINGSQVSHENKMIGQEPAITVPPPPVPSSNALLAHLWQSLQRRAASLSPSAMLPTIGPTMALLHPSNYAYAYNAGLTNGFMPVNNIQSLSQPMGLQVPNSLHWNGNRVFLPNYPNQQQNFRNPTTMCGNSSATAPNLTSRPQAPHVEEQAATVISMEHLQELVSKLEGVTESKDEVQVPSQLMETKLLRHQRLALSWMIKRETDTKEPFGGILADDQGLGKTVTTIALILSSPRAGVQNFSFPADEAENRGKLILDPEEAVEDVTGDEQVDCIDLTFPTSTAPPVTSLKKNVSSSLRGGTLVVCPTTLLHQWAKEVRDKTSISAKCDVYIYHGKNKDILLASLSRYTVVLTTYQTLVLEMPEDKKPSQKQDDSNSDGTIVDLTGELANGSKGSKRRRVEGSGRGGPLFRIRWHRAVLDEAQTIKNPRTLAAHAAWGIRASKRWCLTGTPLQNSIDDLYSYLRFLKHQPLSTYSKFKTIIKDPITGKDPERGFQRLQTYLAPILLRRTKASKIDGRPIIELPDRQVNLLRCQFSDREREFYMNLEEESRKRVRMMEKEGTIGQNYVNMLWMCLRLRQACNHPRLVRRLARDQNDSSCSEIEKARNLPSETLAKLLGSLNDDISECVACSDVADDPVMSICGHVFCRQCVATMASIANQGNIDDVSTYRCPCCGCLLGSNDSFGLRALKAVAGGSIGESDVDGESSSGLNELEASSKVKALMNLLIRLRKEGQERLKESLASQTGTVARSVSANRLARALARGTTKSNVQQFKTETSSQPKMEKVIIFSQWTSMLDIIEGHLRGERFDFRRLDGTMNINARQQAIEEFTHFKEVTVMLVSLKAASLGVNLVSANHVVLLDLWYNPATEDQAIDRAHRIGQTRPVHVTRITVEGTIEDRILELQEKKKVLAEAALGEGDYKNTVNKLTVRELYDLFAVSKG